MKRLLCSALVLGFVASAFAAPNANSPANRCKRYAQANAFQSTIAQLCGSAGSSYGGVLQEQSCDDALGKDEVKQQGQAQTSELRAEYDRIGANAFCSKYQNRR